jgi:replication-associated recombination protein RarA
METKDQKKYIDKLFTELFEPKSIEHFVLPKRVKSHFPDGNIINNSLLCGTAGCGKSSFAKFIGKKYNFYYVNSSLDTSKELLEEDGELYKFCSSYSFENSKKVVLLDEIDGVSNSFFNALKGFMDTFKNVRFLATTNHIESIPQPILSRFSVIDYNFETKEEEEEQFAGYKARVYKIMVHLGMTVEPEALTSFCNRFFPDFRFPLNTLQRLINNNIKVIDNTVINKKSFEHNELYTLMLSASSADNRHIHTIITSISNPLYAVQTIDRELLDYIDKNAQSKIAKYGDLIICIAKYNNMISNRVDPMLCLKAMVFELINILR